MLGNYVYKPSLIDYEPWVPYQDINTTYTWASTGTATVVVEGNKDYLATGQQDIMIKLENYSEAGTTASPTSATTYGEMGWLGKMLPKDPGSATWMFKAVPGVGVDNLSSNQSTYARGYNMNVYETFQGQNDITKVLFENFEITGNPKHAVFNDVMKSFIKEKKLSF